MVDAKRVGLFCAAISLVVVLVVGCVSTTPIPTPSIVVPSPKTSSAAPVTFAGKTITMVVPFSPGGSVDIAARLYSLSLKRFLAGNPNILVRNMPGGAETLGANYVYASKPDGRTLLITGANALSQLVRMKAVKYDLLKMRAIVADKTGVLWYITGGIISKPEDILKAKGLIFGAPGGGGGAYQFITANEVLKIPVEKTLWGYSSGSVARRAFLAGENNFVQDSLANYLANVVPLVAKGEVLPVFQSGVLDDNGDVVKGPGVPADILTVKELYQKLYNKPPAGVEWSAYNAVLAANRNFNDALFLPPETPDEIVRAYWDAAQQMLKDPEFTAAAGAILGTDAAFGAGEGFEKVFRRSFGITPEVYDWLRAAIQKYGLVVE